MSVQSIMDDAQAFALSIQTTVNTAQTNLETHLLSYGGQAETLIQQAGATPPFTPRDPPAFDAPVDPELPQVIDLNLPDKPGDPPEYQDISDWAPPSAPTNNAVVPVITFPDKPDGIEAFNGSLPNFTIPAFPTVPDSLTQIEFTAPTITTRPALTAPQVLTPQPVQRFSGVAPTMPTGLDNTYQNAYSGQRSSVVNEINGYLDAELAKINPEYHNQMSSIEAQLTKYLAGGTGLAPEVEDAIYVRARSKNDAETRRVIAASYADTAARGFTLPTGALFSAAQQARQAGADNNAAGAREIVVMQAELEQKNLQFAVTTSSNLRVALLNSMMSYMGNLGQLNGQALEYAKGVLSSIIDIYNLSVKSYEVGIEAFKAEVVYFDSQLKLVMADVEIFQAKIKNEEALTNIDRAKVDVYRAQLEGLNTLANVYKSQVDAAIGEASLQKLNLEVFQSQVQVFTAQVQSKDAEWKGFMASVSGEEAKAKIYATEIDAFNANMKGYAAQLEGQISTVKSQSDTNKARADQYGGQVQSFVAQVQAEADRARTLLQNQQQYWSANNAKNQNLESINRRNVELYRQTFTSEIQAYTQNLEYKYKAADVSVKSMDAYGRSIGLVIESQAKIAQSALAGINTLASENKQE